MTGGGAGTQTGGHGGNGIVGTGGVHCGIGQHTSHGGHGPAEGHGIGPHGSGPHGPHGGHCVGEHGGILNNYCSNNCTHLASDVYHQRTDLDNTTADRSDKQAILDTPSEDTGLVNHCVSHNHTPRKGYWREGTQGCPRPGHGFASGIHGTGGGATIGMHTPPLGFAGDATCGTGVSGSSGVTGAGQLSGIAGFGQGSYISIIGGQQFTGQHGGGHRPILSTRHFS
ncbi:uncharacterized protein CBL_09666 [Carabus blaptoides fortunei]